MRIPVRVGLIIPGSVPTFKILHNYKQYSTIHPRSYYHCSSCERLWLLANLKNWLYLENAWQLIPHRVADSHEDRGVQWSNVQMIHLKKMINKLWGNNQKIFLTPNPAQERPPRPRASERNTVEVPLLMISAVSSMNTALIVLCVRVKKVRNWSLWLSQLFGVRVFRNWVVQFLSHLTSFVICGPKLYI